VGWVQDMANLLWGYATLGRTPAPTLLQSIAVEAVLKVEKFKHFELINVLWGFAMVRAQVGPPAQRPPLRVHRHVVSAALVCFSQRGDSLFLPRVFARRAARA
jgi:hypothetical protein